MFVRTLLLTTCLGASLAIAGVAAAPAKDGFKIPESLEPIPPLTQTDLPVICQVTFEDHGRKEYVECRNTVPNPFPPKDQKTLKFQDGPFKEQVTAWPDGRVLLIVRGLAETL